MPGFSNPTGALNQAKKRRYELLDLLARYREELEYVEFGIKALENHIAQLEQEEASTALQTTLGSIDAKDIPPEFLDTVEPGQREKSALRGPRTRKATDYWDKGIVYKCYKAFLKILEESPDGAPVQHVVDITGCGNTMNAYAAAFAILKNHPTDYVYVERKPWPQTNRKLRGLMHRNRAAELGLKLIELEEEDKEVETL